MNDNEVALRSMLVELGDIRTLTFGTGPNPKGDQYV
jgi:hypothetical protein